MRSRRGGSKPSPTGQGHLVERYEKTINTLTKRPLIGFLANRNVLPKYGFPTDTVELRTAYTGDPVGRKLDLLTRSVLCHLRVRAGCRDRCGWSAMDVRWCLPTARSRADREELRRMYRL